MIKHFLIFVCLLMGIQSTHAQSEATVVYIELYKKIAVQEMKRTGIPASITLAQGILESNSGESNLAKQFNNHFGIKCKSDWKGETTFQDDDTKQECFRVYPTALASFKDHSDFLKNRPNYAPLFALDPVDDSAWAYGLKKAGYATAADYPKRLLKIIDDYELSQYNFPELDDEIEEKDSVVTKTKDIILPKLKDTLVAKGKDTISNTKVDTIRTITQAQIIAADSSSISLSKVSGVNSIDSGYSNEIPTMKGVEILKENTTKDSLVKPIASIDTTKNEPIPAPIIKNLVNYPKGRFKINQVPAIWAEAGSSYLQIAQTYRIPLYKLFAYNDIEEADILSEDQLVFLSEKKKTGEKSIHIAKEGETLYSICQTEGVQLKFLISYNINLPKGLLKEGTNVFLFKPKEATPIVIPAKAPAKVPARNTFNLFKRKNK
jgi:Mannosyl-glycoprotein endo-beta-N-acetylglucosaminidase